MPHPLYRKIHATACFAVAISLATGCANTAPTPDYRTIEEHRNAAAVNGALPELQQTHARIIALDDAAGGPQLHAVTDLIAPDTLTAPVSDGPLAGVPVLLKASIDTGDALPTHAGSLALAGRLAEHDAPLVRKLREAGAVIIGKANMSEWANIRDNRSVSGWSSVGGQTRNPHVLDRNTCGSSSGSAASVAAGYVPLAIGTETDGSIVCPAGVNGVVGYKPSLGLVSAAGIVPISHTQDTPGPFARSVEEVALAVEVMAAQPVELTDGLRADALQGKRIGVWRGHFGAGSDPRLEAILDNAISALRQAGAVVMDPVEINITQRMYEAELAVFLHEMRASLGDYLSAPVRNSNLSFPRNLAEVIAFNNANAQATMPWFGQDIFLAAEASGTLTEADYQQALADSQIALRNLASEIWDTHELDAVIALTNAPAWPIDAVAGDRFQLASSSLAAITGWPTVSLPAGTVMGLPVGVSLIAKMSKDADLLALAYALEQRLPAAPRPLFRQSLE